MRQRESVLSGLAALRRLDANDARSAALSFAYFFFLLGGYYVLRPARDALGIEGGVRELSYLFLGTLAGMLLLHPAYVALVARLSRRRFVGWTYAAFIAQLLAFWLALWATENAAQRWIARAFFVWVSIFNMFIVSIFWSVMADVFEEEKGRWLFGLIGAGGTLGALAGAAFTEGIVERIGVVSLLPLSAVALTIALGACLLLPEREVEPRPVRPRHDLLEGARRLLRSPLLLGIAGYILLMTVAATLLYFVQARVVSEAAAGTNARAALFAGIDKWTNATTLALELGVTGPLMGMLGVGLALAALPAVLAAGFALLALSPSLKTVIAVQVLRRGVNYGLSRPAREVLYTVVDREERFAAKNFIDTIVYRSGDAIAAGGFESLTGALALSVASVSGLAVPMTLGWIGLAVWLSRRHRRGRASLAPSPAAGTQSAT